MLTIFFTHLRLRLFLCANNIGTSFERVVFALITTLFCSIAECNDVNTTQRSPLEQLDLKNQFAGFDARLVGFNDRGAAVLSIVKSNSQNIGYVTQWKIKEKKAIGRTSFSKDFSSSLLSLSFDGKWFLSGENTLDPSIAYNNAHRAVIISSANSRVYRSVNLGAKNGIMGFTNLSNNSQHIVVRMDSLIPYGDTFIYGRNRLEWLNLKTGRTDKKLPYRPANEIDKLLLSPDKKYLLGLFYSEPFDPFGESDYLNDQLERQGFVDIINPKTGKILWHIEPSKQRPIGDPLFFISPTRFISSDTVFNIATKTARPWNAITPTRKCLAAVPGHSDYALFLTPSGLQLRDWQRDKLIVSWPAIKKPGRILFSPDLKMFSFKRGSLIQFWKFDPKWTS